MRIKSIKHKVAYSVVVVGIATFFIMIALAFIFIIPALRKTAVEESRRRNNDIIRQINTLNNYIEDYTENLALAVESNKNIMQYFVSPTEKNKNIASLDLNNLISNEGFARSVIIVSGDELILDSINRVSILDYQLLETNWFRKLQSSDYGRGFSVVYTMEIPGLYYTSAYMKNFYHNNKKYSYIVFFGLNNLLFNINGMAENAFDYYGLVDAQGNVFYSGGNPEWEHNAIEKIGMDTINGYLNEDGGYWFINTALNSKWKVVSFISRGTVFKFFSKYVLGVMLGVLIFLGLLLITLYSIMTRILKPISYLSSKMDDVAKGNLDCRIEITSNDEIGQLSSSFNQMISDLKHSIEIIEEKEKREKQAKFSLLVSQINPHFIYNTLNSINYLARKGRTDAIITVNSALITILQDRLRVNDIKIYDTIANEMKVLNQYILIQKYMYDGDLQVHWHVDEELLTELIPKNLIQPLVENSLFHGLISEESGEINGVINICIDKVGENIVIKVIDNGEGMDKDKLEKVKNRAYSPDDRGKKIGLSNIRDRLYYLYGNNDCLSIDSKPNEGTCVTLTLGRV